MRLYQRYTVPKTVRLSAPTLFYLGKRGAKRRRCARRGELKRARAGRYTSQVTVTLPTSWHGAFRYASCFRASAGSGMGDPGQSCPQLRLSSKRIRHASFEADRSPLALFTTVASR